MKLNHNINTLIEPYIFKDIFKLKDKKEMVNFSKRRAVQHEKKKSLFNC